MERIRKVLLWFRQSEERSQTACREAGEQTGAAIGGDHEPG
jgi:hypothetical protein